MTGSRPSTRVGVRGGAGGIEARYDDMVSAARLFGGAAIDVGGAAFALHGYLLDPGLVSGGLLDPVGGFHFEEHLAEALDGRGGLTWIAARCAAVDAGLRAAAAAYETGDRLMTRVHSLNDGLAGVPDAALRGAATAIATGSVRAGVERFAASDPELVDDLVIAAGGVHGRVLLTATALLQDGRPVVDALGRDPAPTARVPPRDVRDLIGALALRNQASHGEIDVRILARLDGTRAAIVDIPGTKSW
ncbi:MAG: hypothetical protein QOG80_1661, partial [Pseudonocardiales bacterium]|nr:hypothetical protein [Pseudonocardiales bacterium]